MKLHRENQSINRFRPLPENLLLRGGRIVDPASKTDTVADVTIVNGVITAIGAGDAAFDGEVVDCAGKVISPGWMDMHVHIREPGREDEETVESGVQAAANGGFTAICCMPNTSPAVDSQEIIQYISDRARLSLVAVYPIAAITKNRDGQELAEVLDLVEQGAVAISDDTNPLVSAEVMRRALEYSRMVDIPVISICDDPHLSANAFMNEGFVSTCLGMRGMPPVAEEIALARDIALAEYCDARLHTALITTARSVALIGEARARGVKITASITPHHFTLTDEAVRTFDTNTKVKPPLRREVDRQALLAGLKDGIIDTIVSDHSPHAWEEKAAEFIYAPFGIVGMESAMALSLQQLHHNERMGLSALIEKFAVNPYRILGVPAPSVAVDQPANLTLFDADAQWTFDVRQTLSKSKNSIFDGWKLKGKPFAVINRDQIFYSFSGKPT